MNIILRELLVVVRLKFSDLRAKNYVPPWMGADLGLANLEKRCMSITFHLDEKPKMMSLKFGPTVNEKLPGDVMHVNQGSHLSNALTICT